MYKNGEKKVKVTPSRYFKAYLNEVPNERGDVESHVKVMFSKKPFSPEQFTSLVMGVFEAYAQELLTTNPPEAVYEHFNNAFGIFLAKLVPQDYIYEHSEAHAEFKEHVEDTLGRPEDVKNTEDNRFAAYLLCHDILTKEVGLTPESANLILNRRLGLITPVENGVESVEKPVSEENTDGET
jgi:hypothetical protein